MRRIVLFCMVLMVFAVGAGAENFNFSPLNIAGDTHFLFGDNELRVGIGTDIGKFSYKELDYAIRGVALKVNGESDIDKVGLSLNLNVNSLFKKIGITFLPDKLNSCIGLSVGLDINELVNENSLRGFTSLYLTIIKLEI